MLLKRYINLLFFVFCFVFVSCSILKKSPVDDIQDEIIKFPPPPDTARVQYLTTINSSNDIKKKRSKFARFILGEEASKGIFFPGDIITSDDSLIIYDEQIKGFTIIDFGEKSFEYFIPQGKGEIKAAMSCAIDSQKRLYVADTKRKEIIVYKPSKSGYRFHTTFGDTDVDYNPTVVMHFQGKIWVLDSKSKKVYVYNDTDYKFLFSFPEKETLTEETFLGSPKYIAGFGDFVYITEFIACKIKVFDLKGNYIRSVGEYGTYPGQFYRPKDLALDKQANLYVVDAAFGNVQMFNDKGQTLMFFGGQNNNKADLFLPRNIHIDYKNIGHFEHFVDSGYKLDHLIFVTSQHGNNKIKVYGRILPKN